MPDTKPKKDETFEQWFERQKFNHFKADELTWYFGKVRNGVRNTYPPRELWANIVPTLRVLDKLRDHFGKPITITSTYRALPYNRSIGSPDGSMHILFNAADFTVAGISPRAVRLVLVKMRKDGEFTGGIGLYPTFNHLDTRSYNADW